MFVNCKINSNLNEDAELNTSFSKANLIPLAGILSVLSALLFPVSTHIIDVLIIFNLSLTAALLLITYRANTAAELTGFPLLAALATMLRIYLIVTCCRLILTNQNFGTIIAVFNKNIITESAILSIFLFTAASIVIFTAICKAAKDTSKIAWDFNLNIFPKAKNKIQNEFHSGIINEKKAQKQTDKILQESKFYIAMDALAKLNLSDAVIELVAILVSISGAILLATTGKMPPDASLKTYFALTIGAIIIVLIPALITTIASKILVRKTYLNLDNFNENHSQKNNNHSRNQNSSNNNADSQEHQPENNHDSKQQNMKSNNYSTTIIHPDSYIPTENSRIKDLQWSDENSQQTNSKLWSCKKIKNNYKAFAKILQNQTLNPHQSILMAAANSKELPVTIPVNTAIHLAKMNQKTLLIDLDTKRNAVAEVFEIPKTIPTKHPAKEAIPIKCIGIKNLWIYPADLITGTESGNQNIQSEKLTKLIKEAKTEFDYILIYAPLPNQLGNPGEIAKSINSAIIFGTENNPPSKLKNILNQTHCIILTPEIFTETPS